MTPLREVFEVMQERLASLQDDLDLVKQDILEIKLQAKDLERHLAVSDESRKDIKKKLDELGKTNLTLIMCMISSITSLATGVIALFRP